MNAFLPKFLDVTAQWAMRHEWPPGQRYTAQLLDIYTLWFCLDGEVHLEMDGREWQIPAGRAMLCPPHRLREMVTPGGATWLSVSLRATLFGNVDVLQLMCPPVIWEPDGEDGEALLQAMSGLVREWSAGGGIRSVTPATVDSYVTAHYSGGRVTDATSILLCDAYSRAIVALCWRALGKMEMQQAADHDLPPWFSVALQQLHADPNVSVDQLARDTGISTAQLRRHFHRRFGASPREYLNRVRLEDARQLLETTDLSAGDIAGRIGFHSSSHFNMLFKSAFGVPPAQYRELSRQPRTESERRA